MTEAEAIQTILMLWIEIFCGAGLFIGAAGLLTAIIALAKLSLSGRELHAAVSSRTVIPFSFLTADQ